MVVYSLIKEKQKTKWTKKKERKREVQIEVKVAILVFTSHKVTNSIFTCEDRERGGDGKGTDSNS